MSVIPKATVNLADTAAFEYLRRHAAEVFGTRNEHLSNLLQGFTSAAWQAMRAAVDQFGSTLPDGWMVAARISMDPPNQTATSYEAQHRIEMLPRMPGDLTVPDHTWSLFARKDAP